MASIFPAQFDVNQLRARMKIPLSLINLARNTMATIEGAVNKRIEQTQSGFVFDIEPITVTFTAGHSLFNPKQADLVVVIQELRQRGFKVRIVNADTLETLIAVPLDNSRTTLVVTF